MSILDRRIFPFFVFALIFAALFPHIHLGLDMLDTGYHLTNQELMNRIGLQFIQTTPFWWLTDLAGGFWLKLFNTLWGAKIGGLLVYSGTGSLSAYLLTRVYPPSLTMAGAILIGCLFSLNMCFLNYSTVPALLFLLFGISIYHLSISPYQRIYPYLAGLSFSLLVFSKMTLISAALIPISALFAAYFLDRPRFGALFKAYLKTASVALLIALLFSFYLTMRGLWSDYFLFSLPSEQHRFSALAKSFVSEILLSLPLLIRLFLPAMAIRILFDNKQWFLFVFFASFLHFALRLSIFNIFTVFLIVSLYCLKQLKKRIEFPEALLMIIALAMPFCFSFYSADGLSRVREGFWLFGWISMSLIFRFAAQIPSRLPKIASHTGAFLLIALVGWKGVGYAYLHMNREEGSLSELSYRLTAPRLRGIKTHPERGQSIDALIEQIQTRSKTGDAIFAYHNLPMVYYASEREPYGGHCWINLLPIALLAEKIISFATLDPPALIVKSKTNVSDPRWGHILSDQLPPPDVGLQEKIDFIDQEMEKLWDLELVWSNADFDLLKPSKRSH